VLVVAAVAFAVAQGGGGGDGPLNAIAKAAEVTQREPGGRALLHAIVTSPAEPEVLTERGSMIFDDSGRSRGEMTVSGGGLEREAKVLAVVDGLKAYVSSEAIDSLPEGKKWLEVNYASAVEGRGTTPTVNGPKEGLKILERVLGAERIGQEKVDGVPTTRYRGTLPTTVEAFGVKVHFTEPRVEVWIDGQDRVRRMHVVVSGSLGEDEAATTTEMDVDYVEFGRVPKIPLPDPAEVVDMTGKLEATVRSAAEGD
jgi:hypothetical protein